MIEILYFVIYFLNTYYYLDTFGPGNPWSPFAPT